MREFQIIAKNEVDWTATRQFQNIKPCRNRAFINQITTRKYLRPTDNCFIETFNGSLRDECLNVHWFASLAEARAVVEAWRRDYNESRPHMALGNRTPAAFAREVRA
jgi:transposase InsO family protein